MTSSGGIVEPIHWSTFLHGFDPSTEIIRYARGKLTGGAMFEYRVESGIVNEDNPADVQKALQDIAAEGWQLHTVIPPKSAVRGALTVFIFERRKPVELKINSNRDTLPVW